MTVITGRNVHSLLGPALRTLMREGETRNSRNGPVIVMPSPTMICYQRPMERVLTQPKRDANPFFHLFESLWMLAGRNDVAYVSHIVKRMREYSDDGVTLHGAYGHRWRKHFAKDQLCVIINRLQRDRDDRRCVLQMWDATTDLGTSGKDVPCNTQAVFQRGTAGELNMTVFNRSNDMIWGALGANAVHFSVLQEYVARSLEAPVGTYWQISANMHAYTNVLDNKYLPLVEDRSLSCYEQHGAMPYPLMTVDRFTWDRDLALFMEQPLSYGFTDPFFTRVAKPMWAAHQQMLNDKSVQGCTDALETMKQCLAEDWSIACVEWIARRAAERASRAVA